MCYFEETLNPHYGPGFIVEVCHLKTCWWRGRDALPSVVCLGIVPMACGLFAVPCHGHGDEPGDYLWDGLARGVNSDNHLICRRGRDTPAFRALPIETVSKAGTVDIDSLETDTGDVDDQRVDYFAAGDSQSLEEPSRRLGRVVVWELGRPRRPDPLSVGNIRRCERGVCGVWRRVGFCRRAVRGIRSIRTSDIAQC